MTAAVPDLKELARRMEGAVEALRKELQGLRTGRASASLLEPIQVEAYGGHMALKEVASITVPEPRLLQVSVWDKGLVKAVEKAIRNAGLGLNPVTEGTTLRVPLPELTQERRNELAKAAHKYAEQARVAVRNLRHEGLNQLKRADKDTHLADEEYKRIGDEIQKLTDRHIEAINKLLEQKEKDIRQV
ncbi:MAG: ribosome recycling factor [Geminicoccaceae bacterium]|nr:ribosome recycling factor [Geminicoccaceae bacterium]MCX8100331.1 ribosome recycling factor [Geminicoccaceae bacterium]MDW8368723.1 ribosome recycling factor [Geminicoccaceae bacterium]